MSHRVISSIVRHPGVRAAIWIILTCFVLWLDYLSGPAIAFPVFILVPVTLAAWFNGKSLGIALSLIGVAVAGFLFPRHWFRDETLTVTIINAAIQLSVFLLIAFLVDRVARLTRHLKTEVKVLEGLLPVCSFCKKIRDRDDTWYPMEKYIADHSGADFTHGVCPDCARTHYGHLIDGTP